ncbi:MAG: SDR family NAD(P)-dependent oxidoreductase [Candidatus Altiarchaeales archaeon]|nr:SDR family NAD(P)-dependent oxidoreductase [Candidatus Altiarchaeales archaeon]
MGKKVLVTGGAGFIGSHLVDKLIAEGHEVRILDNLDCQVHLGRKPDYLNKKADFILGDVRNIKDIERAFEDVEIVFHQAAAVGVAQSMYKIHHYVDVNTVGTAKILEFLVNKEHSVKKFVVASSMSVYGEGAYKCGKHGVVYPQLRTQEQLKKHDWEVKCPQCGKNLVPIPTTEEKPLQPTSIYAITKRDQEEMCLAVGQAYDIPTVALRYFNVYGPRQALSNPYTGVAAIFSSRIKNNNPPLIFEDGLQARDFVYVTDVVEANLLAMREKKANYESFNVSGGSRITILQVAETLAKLFKKKIKPKIVNKYRAGDIRYCFGSIDKIKKMGYRPKVSFEEGMKNLVEWGIIQEARDLSEKATQELVERNLVEK